MFFINEIEKVIDINSIVGIIKITGITFCPAPIIKRILETSAVISKDKKII